jgi:hypothetical protein
VRTVVPATAPEIANGAAKPVFASATVGSVAPVGFVVTVGITVKPLAAVKIAFEPTKIGVVTAVDAPAATGVVEDSAKTVKFSTALFTALAGATDVITPIDIAATATSEIRLKVVFVDMFFLSLVELRTIRTSAWAEMSPS